MQRIVFIFRIKPELKDKYKKDHDNIWPELVKAMKNTGISNYSIYFRKDGTLFAYLEADDFDKASTYFERSAISSKWEKYMDRYFIKKDSKVLGPEKEMLEEVFHMD